MTVAISQLQAGMQEETAEEVGMTEGEKAADGQVRPFALELKHVSAGYGQRRAIDDLTVEIAAGKRVGPIGPNGAGKSTLFRSLVGLLPLMSGQVLIQGQADRKARRQVAYVPQFGDVDWAVPAAVIGGVIMGVARQGGWPRL